MISDAVKLISTMLITSNNDKALESLPSLPCAFCDALEPLLPDTWGISVLGAKPYENGLQFVYKLHKPGMGLDMIRWSIRFNRVDNFVDGTMEYLKGKRLQCKAINIRRMKLPDVTSSEEILDWINATIDQANPGKVVTRSFDVTFGMLVHYTVKVHAKDEDDAIRIAREIDLNEDNLAVTRDEGMEELSADVEPS